MSKDLKEALDGSFMFSRTSAILHQLVIDFKSLEAMQHARDVIIKACVPEVRKFAQSTATGVARHDDAI